MEKNKNILESKLKIKNLIYLRIFILIILFLILIIFKYRRILLQFKSEEIYFDKYETYVYDNIKEKLTKTNCSKMWSNQREFLNGIIRKFRPKKVVEIGVNKGGSSIIILNALKDINNAFLFSIDLDSHKSVGICINKYFPYLNNKFKLYKGNIAIKFIEEIGKNIDLAFFDTSHFEPGEILDFLMILPFLKEGALVGFHDIAQQINQAGWPNSRNEWAPYIIFNVIRGTKYLPSGNKILGQDIGFIKLDKNQKKYYHDYFRVLGGQWQYFPKEEHIQILRDFIKKYYDEYCLIVFDEAVKFNRRLVKNNPKEDFYVLIRKNINIIKKYKDNKDKN